jgi:hypothetical protein
LSARNLLRNLLALVLVTPSVARNLLRNLLALVLVWPKAKRSEA